MLGLKNQRKKKGHLDENGDIHVVWISSRRSFFLSIFDQLMETKCNI